MPGYSSAEIVLKVIILPKLIKYFLILTLMVPLGGLYGQDASTLDELFTVKNIQVDETATSSARARTTAIRKAEEYAFDTLLKKVVRAEDLDKITDISHRRKQSLMIGIDFLNEQTSSRRYIATLNVRFEPSYVSEFLESHAIPHVVGAGTKLLVFHAHKRGLKKILYEQDRIRDAARRNVDWENRLRQYETPDFSLQQRLSVGFDDIHTVSMTASVSKKLKMPSIIISSTYAFSSDGMRGLEYSYMLTEDGVKTSGMLIDPTLDEEQLLSLMYEDILTDIDELWKSRQLINVSDTLTMDIRIAARTFEEYQTIQNRLESISLIRTRKTNSIGIPLSDITLVISGTLEQFNVVLGFTDLIILDSVDGRVITIKLQ